MELGSQLVAMRLRVDACLGRGLLNFLSMFIEPGEKEDVASSQAPLASKDVGSHGGIGVSDMRYIVHVIDRRRDVEGVRCTHGRTKRYQVGGEDARSPSDIAFVKRRRRCGQMRGRRHGKTGGVFAGIR